MPIYTPIYSDKRDGGLAEIIETKETYTERVLEVYEDNGYNDSDFYAVVWDDEQNCILHKQYATTRFYSEGYGAKVDATTEIIEKAKAEKTKYFLKFAIETDIENAKSVKIGKKVEVTIVDVKIVELSEKYFGLVVLKSFLIIQKNIVLSVSS